MRKRRKKGGRKRKKRREKRDEEGTYCNLADVTTPIKKHKTKKILYDNLWT